MRIFKSLVTIFRGGVSDVGEFIIDHNQIRLLRQTLRDAEANLDKSETALIAIIADRKAVQRDIEAINGKIEEFGELVQKCLAKDEAMLAEEVAGNIVVLEAELATKQDILAKFKATEAPLQSQRLEAQSLLNSLKQQLASIEAQESMLESLQSVSKVAKLTLPANTEGLITKIKKHQQHTLDEMELQKSLSEKKGGAGLEHKLIASGIKPQKRTDAKAVVARYQRS